MYPIKLKPALKDYLWGGTRLKTEYGIETDMSPVAEAWVLSCHKDGQSTVANGEFAGLTLSEAIEEMGPACLGNRGEDFSFFPMLIKFIDAEKSLSIQVHPDDEYALKNENQFGKTEMWYVVDAKEGSTLYYGLKNEVSREEFKKRIEDGTVCDVLNAVPVKKGDCFFIKSGTIHAIGPGLLIAEIQQNSNCTYRVYDFGRLGADGKPRELHVEKALKVAELCPPSVPYGKPAQKTLASCKYFTVNRYEISGEQKFFVDENSFTSLVCVDGNCSVDGVSLNKGESVFLPACYGNVTVTGNGTVLESRV